MTDPINNNTLDTTVKTNPTDEIARLENEVKTLKEEIEAFETEKERIRIEAKLSIEDAQLARSFSRKNYTPLLNELFEVPSKKLRRQSLIIFILSLLSIGVLLSQHLFPNLLTQIQNKTSHTDTHPLAEKIQTLEQSLITTQRLIDTNHTTVLTHLRTLNEAKLNEAKQQIPNEGNTTSNNTPATTSENVTIKETTIRQQARKISEYVQRAATQKGFPTDFTTNKTSLAQLYLIVMQHANKEPVYYEAYLEAMQSLNINDEIIPKDINDLVQLDTDFLQATTSAYIITKKKQEKQWRYRDSDQKFSSYYNPNINYNLGPWQIVNDKKDYKNLPNIFALNIQRILSQLSHNNKQDARKINSTIFYHAYPENNKNNALMKLLDMTEINRSRDMIVINTHHISLPFNKQTITQLQQKLAEKGLMPASIINGIAGPKTRASVKAFQQSEGLTSNGKISISLLKALNISPSYASLF